MSDSEIFKKYIPFFEYELIKGILENINDEYIAHVKDKIPDNLLELLSMIIAGFLSKINIPEKEILELKEHIHDRRLEHMLGMVEKYDVQKTRQIARAEGKAEGRAEDRAEGIDNTLMIIRDLRKGMTPEKLAEIYNISLDKILQVQDLI